MLLLRAHLMTGEAGRSPLGSRRGLSWSASTALTRLPHATGDAAAGHSLPTRKDAAEPALVLLCSRGSNQEIHEKLELKGLRCVHKRMTSLGPRNDVLLTST